MFWVDGLTIMCSLNPIMCLGGSWIQEQLWKDWKLGEIYTLVIFVDSFINRVMVNRDYFTTWGSTLRLFLQICLCGSLHFMGLLVGQIFIKLLITRKISWYLTSHWIIILNFNVLCLSITPARILWLISKVWVI